MPTSKYPLLSELRELQAASRSTGASGWLRMTETQPPNTACRTAFHGMVLGPGPFQVVAPRSLQKEEHQGELVARSGSDTPHPCPQPIGRPGDVPAQVPGRLGMECWPGSPSPAERLPWEANRNVRGHWASLPWVISGSPAIRACLVRAGLQALPYLLPLEAPDADGWS